MSLFYIISEIFSTR